MGNNQDNNDGLKNRPERKAAPGAPPGNNPAAKKSEAKPQAQASKPVQQPAAQANTRSEAARASVPHNDPAPTVVTKSSKGPWILGTLAFLASLGALGGVYYLWNQSQLEITRQNGEASALQAAISGQKSNLESLQGSLSGMESRIQQTLRSTNEAKAQLESESGALLGRMSAIEGQIAEVTGSQRIDWMLKEVEHFIMVAERRLSLLGDVNGAIALLGEADNLVREMLEPSARPLRKALKQNLMQLEQAAKVNVDTEGLFLSIVALHEQVDELPVEGVSFEMNLAKPDAPEATPEPGIDNFLSEMKNFADSLVNVQRISGEEIRPLLLNDQRAFVVQNIKLLLEQAQLALLRGDQKVYEASLEAAGKRISSYLRTNEKGVANFLDSLKKLEQATVKPVVPSITESVRAVQVFRDFWQKEKVERLISRGKIETEKSKSANN